MERSPVLASGSGAPLALRWITNPGYDLLWYIAPALVSYLLLYLNLGLGIDYAILWWVWTLGFDGPHVFGTINRTYLDREEWRTRGPLLRRALLWFLPGPLLVFASAMGGTKLPYFGFLLFANLWAYWHVVRQHYGFLTLYQRKNGEPAGLQNRVDYWAFYLLMCLPFVAFLIQNEMARQLLHELGLPLQPSPFEAQLLRGITTVVIGAAVVYLGKELWRLRQGQTLNGPKNLFLFACVPLHLFLCLHPVVATKLHPLLFTVLVTLYHNFQYTGIVWFYNVNRYHRAESAARFGAAARVARTFALYYAFGVGFTLLLRYTHWICTGNSTGPFMPGPNVISQTSIGSLFSVTELAIAFWWGFAFNHYWLDQKIWRVSKDTRLNQDLKLA